MSSPSTLLGRFFLPALMLFAVSVWAQPAAAPKAETETTVDDDGHFVVKFPGAVQRSSQDVDTKVGKIAMHMVYYDGGEIAYMVIYSDYPDGSVAQSGGPEKVCENASNGAVQSVNGTIRTSSPCQLGDVKGLEIIADVPAKNSDTESSAKASVAHLRFFVVGERLYQVMYIAPADQEESPQAGAFFDSFRLIR